MQWANVFHVYQPPQWDPNVLKQVVLEAYRPLAQNLLSTPSLKITLNITASLSEQLAQYHYDDIIDAFTVCAKRGQIEFLASAAYHPLLPLIPKQQVVRQIHLNTQINRKIFGKVWNPTGFYPPELAYTSKVGSIVRQLGFDYILLDEISFAKQWDVVDYETRYQTPQGLGVVFRNREASNAFLEAFTSTAEGFAQEISKEFNEEGVLITALDGENLGHHRHGMDKVWASQVTNPNVTTVTLSEWRAQCPKTRVLRPLACSWACRLDEIQRAQPFTLWNDPENPIHKKQWELIRLVIALVEKHSNADAQKRLDQALASDWFWWASAKPWWSYDIVVGLTERVIDVVAPLTLSSRTLDRLHRLADDIKNLAQKWNATGVAEKRREAYLQIDTTTRFLAGKQVS